MKILISRMNQKNFYFRKKKNFYNSYIIDNHTINNYVETFYSNHDFCYFVMTHLDTVIKKILMLYILLHLYR